ncbi:MAG: amidophosphoribosyltransferase [Bacteroidia bacterium]|nr:amidophosphoribosyltransferase [Bacteroidia bacterium]MCF8427310.1 amidophosphoribosyltransferase [Bacteroidia bacterium]MCF8446223.1 amidophosphoribosyltransferase [Bacteroidia bacterium]
MSDPIKHECGIAMIRLLKPLSFYEEKYGSALYGLKKLYLLMEKQHNRGQDGAGVGVIKFDPEPGEAYIFRQRANGSSAISEIFDKVSTKINKSGNKEQTKSSDYLKKHAPFVGELYLGHLRYGTHGGNSKDLCHPFIRENNWMSRNLMLAGNFNLTNVDELFDLLMELGQHPREKADTVTMLEKMGHFLDEEVQRNFTRLKLEGHSNKDISHIMSDYVNVESILKRSLRDADGGYVMAGMLGHGDAFVVRDPNGIRPCFYYQNDEVVVVTSEKPAIMTGFNIAYNEVKELGLGNAIIIKKNGEVQELNIQEAGERKSCSFERIYFSRGNDREIYKERKMLGHLLASKIMKTINNDLKNTVFSYIPNTAAVAFYGMIEGVNAIMNDWKLEQIVKLGDKPKPKQIQDILSVQIRRERLAVKDAKLRTFITDDEHREDMVAHVYDVTYGLINNNVDTLVVIDDSIVRGTTLKTSILRILDRLHPKKIIIVSSSPQIRYPDCYGIDMSRMKDFVAFQAMVSLLKSTKQEHLLTEVYNKCKAQEELPKEEMVNYVKELYDPFTADEISARIAEIVTPEDINAEVDVIYQSIENLHQACPNHLGDWYFTGNYPTPGGNKVVNKAFINFMEGNIARAY